MGPLVSVVIPTRDRPGQVVEAVTSALIQRYAPLEVWVVDDGSLPPVVLPPALAGDGRVRLVRLDHPQGPGRARNEGVARSAGELVAFLDDDDRWRPQMLARLVAEMGAADEVVLAHGGYDLWEAGRLVARERPERGGDLQRRLLEHPCIAPSTVVVRRRALDAVGGFDPTLARGEDWDLWLRLADHGRIESVPDIVADRLRQPVRPADLLAGYLALVARVAPRLRTLPPAERRRIEARHLFDTGVLRARLGSRAAARRTLWLAWRRHPRALRPLLHLGRTVVGERVWALAALVGRLRRPGR